MPPNHEMFDKPGWMVDRLQDLADSFFQSKLETVKEDVPDTQEESEEVKV
jgi:hypothetical protein